MISWSQVTSERKEVSMECVTVFPPNNHLLVVRLKGEILLLVSESAKKGVPECTSTRRPSWLYQQALTMLLWVFMDRFMLSQPLPLSRANQDPWMHLLLVEVEAIQFTIFLPIAW
jgi:hypothetical protein